MKLSKEKWEQLDELLGEIGFGGYYDLIEVLKTIIANIEPKLTDKIENENDLLALIMLISAISRNQKHEA
jgi:hypothetical protein